MYSYSIPVVQEFQQILNWLILFCMLGEADELIPIQYTFMLIL